jgi:acyl carrier protein
MEKPWKTGLIQGKSGALSAALQREVAEISALEAIFDKAEWRVLLSSNLAECGGVGQVDQASRNAVLSCFALRSHVGGRRTLNIELGARAWYELNEELPKNPFIEQQLKEKKQRYGMSTDECLDTVERILNLDLPCVIVSTVNFAPLMEQQRFFTTDFIQAQTFTEKSAVWKENEGQHPRPDLATTYLAPRSDIEKLLVDIWKTALGFETVGVHDNLFELGGHSLLAVQLLKSINDTFSTHIGLKDLFDFPTVAALSELISGDPIDEEDAALLDQLLEEIEGLSEDSVRSALESES